MKLFALAACLLAMSQFVGCYSTAGTSVVLNHNTGESVLFEGNTTLRNRIAVTAVTYDKVASGMNRVNFQLASQVQKELHLQYRIAWFNSEGMEIDGDSRTYRPLIVQGLDSVTVTGVANSPNAVTSRIRIREWDSSH